MYNKISKGLLFITIIIISIYILPILNFDINLNNQIAIASQKTTRANLLILPLYDNQNKSWTDEYSKLWFEYLKKYNRLLS